MSAKLVAEEGALKGLVLSLEDGEQWVIGRDPDACQLLVEDPSASRKHLICRTTPQGILVENLSTTNPVQVNDEEVKEPRLLQNGDAVKIGSGIFRFYAEAAAQLFKEPAENTANEVSLAKEEKLMPQESPEKEQSANSVLEDEKKEPAVPEKIPVQEEKKADIIQPKEATPEKKEMTTSIQAEPSEERHDSIFDEAPSEKNVLAQINFGLLDTGRWLLKVIGGPNNGAEFSMQAGSSYVIGTDPNACDIVFHDTSVSRQHARISIGPDETLTIEDLKSRNGTNVDGEKLAGKRVLTPNMLVSVGTTSFVVFDREGEMQTIISPLMPSIVKDLQKEEEKKQEAPVAPMAPVAPPVPPVDAHHHATTLGAFILIGILTGLFVVVGIGTSMLFKSEPVAVTQSIDTTKALDDVFASFPNVKYTFNKNTGQLLLVGHVLTQTDKSQLFYALQGLKFIKSYDDSGIVLDEGVWREINQVLEKNPDWKGISVMSPSAGHFVVSGYLQTRSQADRLSEYLSANFPYPDLLEKRIVVDEEVVGSANNILQSKGLGAIQVKLDNGEAVLSGAVPVGKEHDLDAAITQIKEIRGVRSLRNITRVQAPELSVINITDKYEVTGISNQAGTLSVVINGRILMKGDIMDSMTITAIQPNAVLLEKDGTKYRIDFSR